MTQTKEWKHSKGRASPSIRLLGPRLRKRRRRRLSKVVFLSKQARQMQRRPTIAESVLASKLTNLSISYESQYVVDYKGIAAIYDFYLPNCRVLIEVDGGYHNSKDQQQTDRIKDFIAEKKLRRNMLRLTNQEVIEIDEEDLRQLIEGAKGSRHRTRAPRGAG